MGSRQLLFLASSAALCLALAVGPRLVHAQAPGAPDSNGTPDEETPDAEGDTPSDEATQPESGKRILIVPIASTAAEMSLAVDQITEALADAATQSGERDANWCGGLEGDRFRCDAVEPAGGSLRSRRSGSRGA